MNLEFAPKSGACDQCSGHLSSPLITYGKFNWFGQSNAIVGQKMSDNLITAHYHKLCKNYFIILPMYAELLWLI